VRPTKRVLLAIPAALALAAGASGLAAAATRGHHHGRRLHHHAHAAWRCPGANLVPRRGNLGHVRWATFCLINRERFRHHEAPLRLSRRLALAAQRHSESMAFDGYFAHTGPRGETPLSRIRATGYLASHGSYAIGENIAWGTLDLATPRAVVAEWMASPGHRANILWGRFRETAIGVESLRREGQAGGVYTEDFGGLGGSGRSQRSS
jgi:uncharacterized protein YkwD